MRSRDSRRRPAIRRAPGRGFNVKLSMIAAASEGCAIAVARTGGQSMPQEFDRIRRRSAPLPPASKPNPWRLPWMALLAAFAGAAIVGSNALAQQMLGWSLEARWERLVNRPDFGRAPQADAILAAGRDRGRRAQGHPSSLPAQERKGEHRQSLRWRQRHHRDAGRSFAASVRRVCRLPDVDGSAPLLRGAASEGPRRRAPQSSRADGAGQERVAVLFAARQLQTGPAAKSGPGDGENGPHRTGHVVPARLSELQGRREDRRRTEGTRGTRAMSAHPISAGSACPFPPASSHRSNTSKLPVDGCAA